MRMPVTSRQLLVAGLLAVFVAVASPSFAREPWPKPVEENEDLDPKRLPTAELPAGLREALLALDEFTQSSDELPESLEVCFFDLNGDKVDECIVTSPESYSGGPAFVILQTSAKGERAYREIGYVQGSLELLERHSDYFQIENWSRAGGGEVTRILNRFERGRYRVARIEDYTEVGNQFLRARDPKAYQEE